MNKPIYKKIIITTLAILAIGGLVWYYYAITEPFVKKVHVGFSGQARRNPYLALDLLMKEKGDSSESIPRLLYDENLYKYQTILLPLSEIPTERQKLAKLREWLIAGGVLITGATSTLTIESKNVIGPSVKNFLGIRSITDTDVSQISLTPEEDGTKARVLLTVSADIKVAADYQSLEKDGVFLLGLRKQGTGHVVLFNSLDSFNNHNISTWENADYIYDWFKHLGVDSMTIVYSKASSSLFTWLWNKAFMAVMLLFLLIICYIFTVTRRFGPILPNSKDGSRKIMEHIEAAGVYLWTGHLQVELLKKMQHRIKDQIKLRHPTSIGQSTVNEELAKVSGITPADVDFAMAIESEQINEDQFHDKVKILKKIKDHL